MQAGCILTLLLLLRIVLLFALRLLPHHCYQYYQGDRCEQSDAHSE